MTPLKSPVKPPQTPIHIEASQALHEQHAHGPDAIKRFDKLGAGLSIACAIHCAAQPLLLVILPFIGLGFLMNEQLETIFLALTVILAAGTLLSGFKKHAKWIPWITWTLGTTFIVSSRLIESQEQILAISGALSIAFTHFLNQYFLPKSHTH